ncbi:MAG: alkaline phosphatase D family protein [Candidatus Sericytochromatia bacterium]
MSALPPDLAPATLPVLLAGPIVRRVTPDLFALWLVGSQALRLRLRLWQGEQVYWEGEVTAPALRQLPLGERVVVHCLAVRPETPLPTYVHYSLERHDGESWQTLLPPEQRYADAAPRIPVAAEIRELLHGSCRKPHHPSADALLSADTLLARRYAEGVDPPDLLLFSGDQVYVDDLCGPLLLAVHQAIRLLGMPNEVFPEAGSLPDAESLYAVPDSLYGRRNYLPQVLSENRYSRLFNRSSRPVFTSSYSDNHLISFAETFVLYLLCWSPALWPLIELPEASRLELSPEKQALYTDEKNALEGFVAGLPRVQRLLAHLPTYMIFDDHDVTDDWNLTAGWEQAAYGHPFSRRIIGNALMAYWLCQGWGNDPDAFEAPFWQKVEAYCRQPDSASQEAWIQTLFRFEGWQYSLPTTPKLVVLDTRTRRWQSESSPHQPSGLMNWEALSEMQQALLHEDAVILVSPAPIFGVKMVEVIQSLFAKAGQALAVDAENWMAHPGAASTLLNIFRHGRTPQHFVILSGDVHYSFVYDIVLRFRRQSPQIWQITASGLKNEFPQKILKRLGQMNRVLFHRHSPLNWLTRRKHMRIAAREANGRSGQHLYNASAIGWVRFRPDGAPARIGLLTGTGETVHFEPSREPTES